MPRSLLSNGAVLLYGDVGDPWGWGDGFTPADVSLSLAEHGEGDVTVRINSGGGAAFDGMAIYSLLRAHAGKVGIAIDGIAASAASLIAMAGDTIEMRDGAMMMIHDAAGFTFGPAAEHEKQADVLDKLSEQYAGVYARQSGKSAADMRALMVAETWLSADEAIAEGLATAKLEDGPGSAPVTAAAFDYRVYAKAPEPLRAASRPFPEKPKAALAAITAQAAPAAPKETSMTPEEIAAKAAKDAEAALAAAATARAGYAENFYALADRAGLTLREATPILVASTSFEGAKDALIDAMAAKQVVPNPQGGHVTVTADARDKFCAGVSQAVLAQAGTVARDGGNEFNGIRPMDMAREVLARNGVKLASRDPMKIVAAAITHSSGDFANITSNIAEKSMLKGYEEAEETFTLWTDTGSLPDFKKARKVDLNMLPALPQLTESSGYKYLTTGDRAEDYFVATAGGMFSISRQAIINDDLDVFTKIPQKLGRAAKRTIGNDVYGLLALNPAMSDNVALFHATHKNLATGAGSALSVDSLQNADIAMGLQTDRSKNAVSLNITPKHLIVPRALKFKALQILRSSSALGQANPGVTNPVQNIVESVIAEPRLDAQSATAWYFAADCKATDTVQVTYLNGNQEPFMEMERPFDVDGGVFKVRIDYGVKAFAWEGLYRNAGA